MSYEYTWINGQRVEVNVAAAVQAMAAEFERVWGLELFVSSGTRTRVEQAYLYSSWINKIPGFNLAAKPGESNHEEEGPNGPRSVDLRDSGHDGGVATLDTPRSVWLRGNCHRWGFVNDGYTFRPREAWHLTFQGAIGVPIATVAGKVTEPIVQEQEEDMATLRVITSNLYEGVGKRVIVNGESAFEWPSGWTQGLIEAKGASFHHYGSNHEALLLEVTANWTAGGNGKSDLLAKLEALSVATGDVQAKIKAA